MTRYDLDSSNQTSSRPLLPRKLDEAPLTSTSGGCEKRKRRQTEATDGAIACRASGTCTVARGTDPEVSDLIEAVDVVLDVVAVRSQMPTKRTDARPLLSESATTGSRPWQKAFWDPNAVACRRRRRRHAVNGNGIGIGSSATGSETEIETVTTTATLARVAMTMATTSVSAETGKTSARGCIADALTEVRMMSFLMMNAHQVLDADVLMTKTTTLAATRETPRYEGSSEQPQGIDSSHISQRLRRDRSRERTPPRAEPRAEDRPRKKTPPPPPSKDVHSGSEEGEIEED